MKHEDDEVSFEDVMGASTRPPPAADVHNVATTVAPLPQALLESLKDLPHHVEIIGLPPGPNELGDAIEPTRDWQDDPFELLELSSDIIGETRLTMSDLEGIDGSADPLPTIDVETGDVEIGVLAPLDAVFVPQGAPRLDASVLSRREPLVVVALITCAAAACVVGALVWTVVHL